jgi:indole-3-glycerol phosphate synthase
MKVLDRILESKRAEVSHLDATSRARNSRAPMDVIGRLRRSRPHPLRIIAEIKLRSPSAGPLSRKMSPADRAVAYAAAGAAMVSVLCDGPFFDGSLEHVKDCRRALDAAHADVPILAKEFILHPRQIAEVRDRGADAVLLIARIVDGQTFRSLVRAARDEAIEPLAEVVDEQELELALSAGASVIGVNARDLDTLEMDVARAGRVLQAMPAEVVAVHMSGIRTRDDVRAIALGRADATLVGESLMRHDDPRPALADLVRAAR